MHIVYIAGPYSDERGMFYVSQNIANARMAALFVWVNGGVAICPHLNTYLFDGYQGLTKKAWIAGDLEIIKRCDAVWFIPGWDGSLGTLEEKACAERNKIPTLYTKDDVLRFLTDGRL